VIRVQKSDCGEKCVGTKMEIFGIMGKANSTVFQPQFGQCFAGTISLPQTYVFLLTPWCRVLLEKLTDLQLV